MKIIAYVENRKDHSNINLYFKNSIDLVSLIFFQWYVFDLLLFSPTDIWKFELSLDL